MEISKISEGFWGGEGEEGPARTFLFEEEAEGGREEIEAEEKEAGGEAADRAPGERRGIGEGVAGEEREPERGVE